MHYLPMPNKFLSFLFLSVSTDFLSCAFRLYFGQLFSFLFSSLTIFSFSSLLFPVFFLVV